MRIAAILASLLGAFRDVARGTSAPHADLRDRLIAAIVITLVVDIVAIGLIYSIEKGQSGGDIESLWDATYFTTAQLLTLSSAFSNPMTTAGQAICLLIDLYAITIVSTIAGMFGAFFYHRSVQRHGLSHPHSAENPGQPKPH